MARFASSPAKKREEPALSGDFRDDPPALTDTDDWIVLSKHAFPCILGIFEWEQREPQTLEVELAMNLPLDPAAAGDLGQSVNYGETLEQLEFIAQRGKWQLLESMAAAIAKHVLAAPHASEARAQVRALRLCLSKPEVFRGRAVPSVDVRRTRAWALQSSSSRSFGGLAMTALNETARTGAYHIDVGEQREWRAPPGMALHIVAGRVRVGAHELGAGKTLEPSDETLHVQAGTRLLGIAPLPF
ncbi:MAG TPA: dihydroneopterin aldolase [Polyangiaceae bacterium]|nr:dihydroneopterin aldolase [Polyangiaceae bacterium]